MTIRSLKDNNRPVVFGTWIEWMVRAGVTGFGISLSPDCYWTPEFRCGLLLAWSLLLTTPARRSVKINFTTGNCFSDFNVTLRPD